MTNDELERIKEIERKIDLLKKWVDVLSEDKKLTDEALDIQMDLILRLQTRVQNLEEPLK